MNARKLTLATAVATLALAALMVSPARADRDDRRHDDRRSTAQNVDRGRVPQNIPHDRNRGNDRNWGHGHDRDRDVNFRGGGHGHSPVTHKATRVLVRPGYYQTRWVPPVTAVRFDHCGRPYTVVVRPGYHEQVWVEPVYETCYEPVRVVHPPVRPGLNFAFVFKF